MDIGCYGRRYYLDKDVELSRITTTIHNSDESYGRESDGASSLKLFKKCIDDDGNEIITSTPLSANGSVKCPDASVVETKVVNCKKKVFAKGKEIYVQNSKNSDVRVYSLLGNIIANKKADSNMFNITMPA